MIGKPQWFKYRIFGWGVAPKTWQGWVYVAAWAIALGLSMAAPYDSAIKPWVFGILLGILVIDVTHIMMQLPKFSDERENLHQLIIERNCSFAAIIALVGVAIYQLYSKGAFDAASSGSITMDYSIVIVLAAMLLTKVLSTAYVKWRM